MMRFIAALICAIAMAANVRATPAAGWDAHVAGCFPTAPANAGSFDWLPTPWYAKRVVLTSKSSHGSTTSQVYDRVQVAYWRQDCPNNVLFPLLMLRFEKIDRTDGVHVGAWSPFRRSYVGASTETIGSIILRQGSNETSAQGFYRRPGETFVSALAFQSQPRVNDEATSRANATLAIATSSADVLGRPLILFRNGLTFSMTGMNGSGSVDALAVSDPDGLPLAGNLSGTYYDPARSGEGFMVDFLDLGANRGHVFVSWYTYTDAGQALWLTGNADVVAGAKEVIIPIIATTGGRFGPLFRSEDVRRSRWGTLTLRFPNCTTGVFRYTRAQDGQAGAYVTTRLGKSLGVPC